MKIKLGIIGFGGMGKWHAQNAPRAGVEIAAVCDIAEEKQKEARDQIERYSRFDDIKDIQGLRKYTIVVASNDIYVEEIV